jgi:hypothetical protein
LPTGNGIFIDQRFEIGQENHNAYARYAAIHVLGTTFKTSDAIMASRKVCKFEARKLVAIEK